MTELNEIIRLLGERELEQMPARDALKRGYELGYDKGYSEGVVRGCEMMMVKSKEEPTLSRFLPKMPDNLPDLPDGWVYVGGGKNENQEHGSSDYIACIHALSWSCTGWSGHSPNAHYAVRIDAPADIWARFGLMPYEDLFFEHTPGDTMPCDQGFQIDVIWDDDMINWGVTFNLALDLSLHNQIIGWRPADWLERRDSVKGGE